LVEQAAATSEQAKQQFDAMKPQLETSKKQLETVAASDQDAACPNTWQRRWSTFFAEQRIGWQLELAAEKGITFGNIDAIVEHVQ
ncbi:DUF5339 family protein, partial [Salmonella enterica subsp. enterica serovar Anatum]|nr:DUF5339 family protein [Salmonella enterica subsp. enterica serovar Anatum]